MIDALSAAGHSNRRCLGFLSSKEQQLPIAAIQMDDDDVTRRGVVANSWMNSWAKKQEIGMSIENIAHTLCIYLLYRCQTAINLSADYKQRNKIIISFIRLWTRK